MTTSSADVVVYTDPLEWPADVQALAGRAERVNMQFGATWYRNLIDTVFPAPGAARFHVMRQGGTAVAMIALLVPPASNGGARRLESLSNFYTCLYGPAFDPGLTPADLVPLIHSIRRDRGAIASLRLAPMDPASADYRTLMAALEAGGLRPHGFFCFGNWYLPVSQDWPTYLKGREGMVRSTIKRMGKRFAADGGTLELMTGATGPERLAVGIAAYEKVYAASWKVPEPFPDFMPGLIRRCADAGWLRLGVAWLNGEAIAAQVWIVADGRADIYKLAYDEQFKSYSPGTLLTTLMMQHAFEQDHVVEVDYLIGDDPYKQAWMTDRRERWGIIAYDPSTLAGLLGHWREVLGRRAKPLLERWRGRSQPSAAGAAPTADPVPAAAVDA